MHNRLKKHAFTGQGCGLVGELKFKQFKDSDLTFFQMLYNSTRWEEVLQVPWSDDQRFAFLKQQFDAQHQHYQTHYPNAAFLKISKDNEDIGRIYLDRTPESICIIDIALVPQSRNTGIGTSILNEVIKEADEFNVKIVLHVEQHNPAYNWYIKHGFIQTEDKGVYQYLERPIQTK